MLPLGVSTDFDSFDTTLFDFQTAEYTINVGFGTHIQSQKVLVMQMEHQHTLKNMLLCLSILIVSIGATMTELA